jgi:hypothetical protein
MCFLSSVTPRLSECEMILDHSYGGCGLVPEDGAIQAIADRNFLAALLDVEQHNKVTNIIGAEKLSLPGTDAMSAASLMSIPA